MYVPNAYQAAEPRAIVKQHPFATVFSEYNGTLHATTTPLYFDSDDDQATHLIGHFAGNNPHAAAISDGSSALALFQGPHAYISASWYLDKPIVPTWNYVSAQIRGIIKTIDDKAGKLRVLERTVALAEAWNPSPWTMADAPEGKVEALVPHIRAFRIEISEIEGATKLSQMHPQSDRERVVTALEKRNHGADKEIASLMRLTRNTTA